MDCRAIVSVVSRDEVRIFIAFLLIFALFIQWNSVNAYSRYDLTQAIVEDGSADISPYAFNTLDKTVVNVDLRDHLDNLNASTTAFVVNRSGQEDVRIPEPVVIERMFAEPDAIVYSDKAPMASFLAVPPYLVAKGITAVLDIDDRSHWIDRGLVSIPVSIGTAEAVKQFLITLAVSALFGAFLLVLLYRHLERHIERQYALYAVVVAGLGTFLFHYATTFFGTMAAATFGFASFFLLQRYREESRRMVVGAGVLGGLAIATEYYAALIPLGIAFYLLSHRDRDVAYYAAGVVLGTVPLLAYNVVTTGNPFQLAFLQGFSGGPIYAAPCHLYASCLDGVILPNIVLDPGRMLNVAGRLLFYPTRGLLFYAPVLLLAVPGTYALYRRDRRMVLVAPGIFVLLFLFHAVQLNWLAGVSFGPRYMIVALPFLVLPLGIGLKEVVERGRIWQVLVLVLVGISVFNMFLGFNGVPAPEIDRHTYADRFTGMEPVQPEFYPTLFDRFKMHGPRSEPLMSVVGREKGFDISFLPPYGRSHLSLGSLGGEFLLFRTGVLPLIAVAVILAALLARRRGRIALAVGIMILFLAGLTTASVHVISDEYTSGSEQITVHGSNATVAVAAAEDEVISMEVEVISPMDERPTIHASVNGGETQAYNVVGSRKVFLQEGVREGHNEIRLSVPQGCVIPARIENDSSDIRCLNIAIHNLSTVPRGSLPNPLYNAGWYPPTDGTWKMGRNASILFTGEEDDIVRLQIAPPPGADHTVTIEMNGETLRTIPVERRNITIAEPSLDGQNKLRLTTSGCTVPAEQSNRSNDTRCTGLDLERFTVLAEEELRSPIYLNGWHPPGGGNRWMKGSARTVLPGGPDIIPRLVITKTAALEGNMTVTVNGNHTRTFRPSDIDTPVYLAAADLRPGKNILRFNSSAGCVVPSAVGQSDDSRCLSFNVRNISLVNRSEFETLFTRGWSRPGTEGGWMGERGTIMVNEDGSVLPRLDLRPHPALGNITINVSLNGQHVRTLVGDSNHTLYLDRMRRNRTNTIRLQGDRCVAEHGRCASMQVNVSLLDESDSPVFGPGWYDAEDGWRWMADDGILLFHREAYGSQVRLNASRYEHLDNTSLHLWYNRGPAGEIPRTSLQSSGHTVIERMLIGKSGWNRLRLESTNGCRVPARVEGTSDRRCLSLQLRNLSIEDGQGFPPNLTSGWYEQESAGEKSWRWMNGSGTIIFGSEGRTANITLTVEPYAHLSYPTLLLSVNRDLHRTVFPDGRETISFAADTVPGINMLELESGSRCRTPQDEEPRSADTRCLSFRVYNLTID